MKELIEKIVQESIEVQQKTVTGNLQAVSSVITAILSCFKEGGKLIVFGNGGSAADSQHIAAEFIGRFNLERKALPAIALTTDTSILTSLSNDYSFDIVFARQVQALGEGQDIALAISTSGNSVNVIEAVKAAKGKGMKTVSLTGNGGGLLAPLTDLSIVVPSSVTARIQEAHLCVMHCICELVEKGMAI